MNFLVSDYYATGEGRTVCLLITKAYPRKEDYAVEPRYENGVWYPGELANSADFRAAREFIKEFGYMSNWAQKYEKEEFLNKWEHFIPASLKKLLDSNAGNVYYTAKLHFNFG